MEEYVKYYKYLSNEELHIFEQLDYEKKIECILFNIMYDEKKFDINLIKELMLKIYDDKEVEFFMSVLENKTSNDEKKLIEKFSSDKYDCDMFFRNGFSTFWSYEAKILKNKSYNMLNRYLDDLFEWLQDVNWPGFKDVEDILLSIREDDFILGFKKNIKCAIEENDDAWMDNLISIFRKKKIIIEKIDDKEVYNILKDCI